MGSGVLFVHNHFPAQFRDLAETLAARGVPCGAVAAKAAPGLESVRTARYALARGTTPGIFPLAIRPEADLLRAQGAMKAARALRAEGFDPQVIVGHTGWGETVLMDEVWPEAKQVHFAEFFYHGRGLDIGFDTEFLQPTEQSVILGKTKNAVMSLAYTDADAIVAPTAFQASTLPAVFQTLVRVIHEGVDVDAARPGAAVPVALPDGRAIEPGAPVVTHVNNKLEPLRGLHIFLRALPALQRAVPEAQALIFGQSAEQGYGGPPPDGKTWKEVCLERAPGLDLSRVHFMGRTPHETMIEALRLSTAHVYYSYPFVLSWSLIEAMASGCYVIGSDTAPLRDAIEDGVNGRLLPFFDVAALSEALIAACRDPDASASLRRAARETAVAKFSRAKGREAWLELLREMGQPIP